MNKFKAVLQKILSPSAKIISLIYALTLVFIGLSLYMVFTDTLNVLSYIVFGVSAVLLAYSIYVLVIYAPKIKSAIVHALKRFRFTDKLLQSLGYRKLVVAIFSFIFNVLYAVVHAVFAILSRSVWLGALATYYIALSFVRGWAVNVCARVHGKSERVYKERQLKLYRNCGAFIVVLNFALIGALVQMVVENKGFLYAGYLIYLMAAYTFYKAIFSVKHLIQLRKTQDYSVQAINNIGLANSLVSILALQTAMFVAFGSGENVRLFNALTGGAVSLCIIFIGLIMIIKGNKHLKHIRKEK